MSPSRKLRAKRDLAMKAVIICDDFSFAARANVKLRQVGCRPDVRVRWTVKSWPVVAFTNPVMADKFLGEAADAHLIVLSARRAEALPAWISRWLERWAALRQIPDAAVAVINDGIEGGFAKTLAPELNRILQEYGLHLVAGENAPVGAPAEPTAGIIEAPRAFSQFRIAEAAPDDSFRGRGIND